MKSPPKLVLAREPCPLPRDDGEIARSVMPHAGHAHGGVVEPVPVVAPASAEEVASLRASVAEGRCQKVRYLSGGHSIVGFVLEPRGRERHPAVLVARGGNPVMGLIGPRLLLELNDLVDRGFVVVATQYREADGGEGKDSFGGGDVDDVAALAPLAQSLPTVEAGPPFLLGYSRGGMTGALALRRGLPVRAAAFFSGSFDLREGARARPELAETFRELVPGYAADPDGALRERSAVEWGAELAAPILLLAGTRDVRVSFEANAARLHALRVAAGRESKLVSWDDGHGLEQHRVEAIDTIAAWFKAHSAR